MLTKVQGYTSSNNIPLQKRQTFNGKLCVTDKARDLGATLALKTAISNLQGFFHKNDRRFVLDLAQTTENKVVIKYDDNFGSQLKSFTEELTDVACEFIA